jgi:anti-sigma factor RsiW
LNCEAARLWMHPYLDGELDLTRSLEVEEHLAACAACSRAYAGHQALRRALSAEPLYYRAPAGLSRRVLAGLGREGKPAAAPGAWRWRWLGLAAALVVVAVIAWGWTRYQAASTQKELVAEEVVSSSMRALIAGPLMDVPSADRHTVKPWFAGKLDFSPDVQDFAAQGFPLAGGRLDYVANRPVAALVYRHGEHVINLFIWPASGGADTPIQEQSHNGYQVFGWTQKSMAYWAVSDMDAGELRQFVQLVSPT